MDRHYIWRNYHGADEYQHPYGALKAQFETFCSDVGLTVGTAFNIFAKAVVRQGRIPFDISNEPQQGKELWRESWVVPKGEENDPFWSESNLKALNESIRQLEEGKVIEKTWEELEAVA